MQTFKVTVRKNIRSPKYKTLFGVNRIANGVRGDFPWLSVATFSPNSGKETIRSKNSGLRAIYENNRKGITRVYHLV